MNNNNRNNKKKEVLNLIDILSNHKVIYFIDVSGLNSNQVFFLKKDFYKYDIRIKMTKNTMLKIAIEKINKIKKDIFISLLSILNGNITLLFSNSDVSKFIAMTIKKFYYEENIEKPYLKSAYVQDTFYFGRESLDILINLKSKEDIIISILNMLLEQMNCVIISLLDYTENKICKILNVLSSK
ncbi:50S ribosomal protein L10 [Blattabacterium cuenoti]|uniref:50S ribosomal protein L10 n=1 Tax=Blattabacterium cuenoti TaxID=1653831 RepID=UPI00163C5876|nr:50S ribosomal protein L10 [Blattabacterium cuenoti]